MIKDLMTWHPKWVLVTCMVVFAAGVSGIVYSSNYAPLIVLVGIMGLIVLFAGFFKPVWLLYLTLFVILLPTGLIPDTIQSFLNRSLTLSVLATWLVNIVIERRRVNLTPSTVLMLIFMMWGTISLLWAKRIDQGMWTLQVYGLRLILFLLLVPNLITSRSNLEGLLKLMALTGWVLVITGFIFLLIKGYVPGSRFQLLGMNENEIGSLSLLLMPGIIWPILQEPEGNHFWKRLLVLVYIILAIALTVLSGSRGSAISLVVALAVLWVWKPTRPIVNLSIALTLLMALLTPFLFTTLVQRFLVTPDDTFLGGREALWKAAWQLIQAHFIFGTGIGNSAFDVMPYLQTTPYMAFYESVSFHNPLLAIWGDVGLIGLLLYIGVLLGALISFVISYRYFRIQGRYDLLLYFPLLSATALGFILSWVKGGGMESSKTYFLMIVLLLIPQQIRLNELKKSKTL